MVNVTINGITVSVPEGTTIKEAAAQTGIVIPTLCYLKDLNEIGACRVCCVEVEGERRMVTACNNPVREGMVVHTNSPRARETRRVNVELILSQHDCHCATCVRSGNCKLQELANDLGMLWSIPTRKTCRTAFTPCGRPPSLCTAMPRSALSACAACRCVRKCSRLASGS